MAQMTAGGSLRVLVVEDERLLQWAIAEMLSSFEPTLSLASDGANRAIWSCSRIDDARRLGACTILQKPFDLQGLPEILFAAHLDHHQPARH